ncbi:hypothetical protein P280DRAFT_16807 [Massarina eburnea CBS 473.64]|uniref:Uncharacterized protein n=1 Tax=Massarina eburnea CBS 473.64 TaxID=1395130 RepID=A0A6A6SI71_9PLEO|nr:hypothetical protein P280DRAFT_16807 [Massarina eburnea CBS 473.64]
MTDVSPPYRCSKISASYFPKARQSGIRHAGKGKKPGHSYLTKIHPRIILEFDTKGMTTATRSIVSPQNKTRIKGAKTYIQGGHPSMCHAVVAYSSVNNEDFDSILDTSSMQFEDAGRGPGSKGQQPSTLET